MWNKIFLSIGVLFLLSGIYPIRYHLSGDPSKSLPDYRTYDTAIHKILPDSIKSLAAKYNCSGYVQQVEEVEQPNNSLSNLQTDLNIALADYNNWEVLVSSEERAKIKRRMDQKIKSWNFSGRELERIVRTQRHTAANTRFSPSAEWKYSSKDDQTNNVQLVLSIKDDLEQTTVFFVRLSFIHPNTLTEIKEKQKEETNQFEQMENYSELSMKFLYGFGALLFLLGFVRVGEQTYKAKKQKQLKEYLLKEIQQRDNLIDNGHFVAANELAEKYLRFFPDDVEISAFHKRLLDYTNNDPEKAQKAYVEAKKLRNKIDKYPQNPSEALLDSTEKESIKQLLPYNKHLSDEYSKILSLEEETKSHRELRNTIEDVKKSIQSNKISRADEQLKTAQERWSADGALVELRNEVESIKEEFQKSYQDTIQLFNQGMVREASRSLESLFRNYGDMPEIQELKKNYNESKGKKKFLLHPAEIGFSPGIYFKDEVVIGRSDENKHPDIEFADRLVSREHLKLKIANNLVTAEDMGSAGGTFINGEKIEQAELKDGDNLNLSKVYDFDVHFYYENENKLGGLFLNGQNQKYLIVFSKLSFGFGGESLTLKNAQLTLHSFEDIPVITWENGFAIINNETEIKTPIGLIKFEEIK